MYILYVYTVCIYCMCILYVYTVLCILYVYTVCVYCMYILYVYTVCIYCMCILYCVYTVETPNKGHVGTSVIERCALFGG